MKIRSRYLVCPAFSFRWTVCLLLLAACGPVRGAEPANAKFFRAINLNGPPLEIDGRQWEGQDARDYVCNDCAFENQDVRLRPATDANRARMIRSSRWHTTFNLAVTNVPVGKYSVFVYVWEDNNSEQLTISLNGRERLRDFASGEAGAWRKLGPWTADVADGRITLATRGGAANISGIEIWKGELAADPGPADKPAPPPRDPVAAKFFDERVAPLLARHCIQCHGASERKGGLNITTESALLAGGESGEVLAPGKPGESLLWEYVADDTMPKDRSPLTADEKQTLRQWIAGGAKWGAERIDPFLVTTDRRAGYDWWSLQPLRPVEPPPVTRGQHVENPIDNFILVRLEQAGLSPSPPTDSRILIRRVYFDLIGLPPSPEEVAAFERDSIDNPQSAFRNLVDRLLDSPHYGERWARLWLDLVRYGESQGFERNKFRPSAWKYRDFVVEALNADLPFDDFIRWQLAGDVLRPEDPIAVIASGFLAMGPYDLTAYNNGTPDMRAFAREEELEGLVATVCQTFLGLTVNCARCHDHKFDPITQKEFYQISGALGGTYQGDERESVEKSARPAIEKHLASLRAEIDALKKRENSADPRKQQDLVVRRSRLEAVVRLLSGGPVHTTVPRQPGSWYVLARGDFRQPGEVVAPRGIAAVTRVSPDWQLGEGAREADRRKALANWIADPKNPLTPRVIVNRLWGWHFGQGFVPTPSDLGFQGGLPSHPELLDWLAGQLVDPTDGPTWSLKQIHRLIVTSATYRQSSLAPNPKSGTQNPQSVDSDNRLLWRYSPRRLEAEMFRDTVVAVSGQLDPQLGGPGFRDFTVSSAGNNETYTVFDAVGPEFNRRSLYRTCVRSGTSPLLVALDCPDPSVATPRRSVTSTPLQALMLLNNKFMEHYAARFAERLQREAPDDPAAQVRRAYALALSRQPAADETDFGRQYIAEHGLAEFCLVLFNLNEFMFVD